MKTFQDIAELRICLRELPSGTLRVLVPTMGALHEGHLSLIDEARRLAGHRGCVVVSIFVNPTQFGPGEDFEAYPRTLESDLDACQERGADIVFAPPASQMYARDASTKVFETSLSKGLCGASRPSHFDGVCLVVSKLFNLVRPDIAVFGEKDYQQLAIIRRMVRDLNFDIQIAGVPTHREPGGLAMSSRNVFLSPEARSQAEEIYRSLTWAKEQLKAGETDAGKLKRTVTDRLSALSLGRVDYIEAVHPDTLEPLHTVGEDGVVLAVAVFFGSTRLIDNVCWRG